jgi:hypothetical protein
MLILDDILDDIINKEDVLLDTYHINHLGLLPRRKIIFSL